jgi:hypothetical protein
MARPQLVGATAAAMLPAALSAAVLISAPFAGTTTAPLADSSNVPAQQSAQHPQDGTQHETQHETQRSQRSGQPAAGQPGSDLRFSFSVSAGSIATWAASEALLVGLAGCVIVWARRRHYAED